MRRLTLLAGLALAVGVLLPGSGLAGVGGSDRPFNISASGSLTIDLQTGQAHGLGTGTGTHIGLEADEEDLQLLPTTDPTTFIWISLGWTGRAANGDQIFATGSGTVSFTDATHSTAVGTYTVSGGSGRFANATGTVAATVFNTLIFVEGQIATYSWEGTFVGTLSY